MGRLTIKVEVFKALRSNTLYGFIDIVVPEMHLRKGYSAPQHSSFAREESGSIRRPGRPRTSSTPIGDSKSPRAATTSQRSNGRAQ
jgi:hypothetical protein